MAEAVSALGTLTTIVNSAGIMPNDDSVEKLSVEAWDRTFAVNVRAIFLLARHGVAHLRPHGGVVVNVASVHAYAAQPGASAYAATKGAIVAVTQQMALDLAPDAHPSRRGGARLGGYPNECVVSPTKWTRLPRRPRLLRLADGCTP